MDQWLFELLKGIGRFWLHPLFYILILAAFLIGKKRIKKERQSFHTRIFDAIKEIKTLFFPGLVIGLILSIITVGAGVVIPLGTLVLIGAITMIFLMTLHMRWLSAAYTIGFSILVILFMPRLSPSNEWLQIIFNDWKQTSLLSMLALLAMLLLVEGILINFKGSEKTSPILFKSKRGKFIGAHESNRLWLVPIFLLVPIGSLPTLSWWPFFTLGGENYTLFLVPFGLGFYQKVQSMLPVGAIKITGRRVIFLSVLALLGTVGLYWYPIFALITAVVVIFVREWISYSQRVSDDETVSFFSSRDKGMIILGILPKSPAEKMALEVGEIVTKVNGISVKTKKEYYEALQVNRALCKLEVLDHNGEVRFVQRALYAGEHHELGILFIEEVDLIKDNLIS